nr:hypothetical protein [Sunxiuqinia sp.]
MTEIVNNTDLGDGKVNVLQVTDLHDRTLELRAVVSASDSPKAWDLRVYVREELIRFVQDEYPQFLPKERINLTERRPDQIKES